VRIFIPLLSFLLFFIGVHAETILINGIPVKNLYVDSEGRLYLTPGPGRKPVKVEVLPKRGTAVISKSKKLKVEGTAYIHYDLDLKGEEHRNGFKLTRNYIGIRGYFNDKDFFRTTIDIKQEKDSGGNMDGSYVARLKYAYVYLGDILPYTGVELGLSHRPWIDWEEHHGWLHRDLEETLIENHSGAGLINSADLGINFKGKYSIASWEFGIFNGEGYHAEENSEHFGKSLEGRFSIRLMDGFILSGHTVHAFDLKGKNMDRHIYQVHAVYNNPYLLIAAQYIWDRDNYYSGSDVDQKGYSVNGDLKLKAFTGVPLGILARYDYWDPDDSISDNERRHFVLGAFYNYGNHLRFTIANDRLVDKSGDDSSTFMAVTQVKW
jgi:hypothetical protein